MEKIILLGMEGSKTETGANTLHTADTSSDDTGKEGRGNVLCRNF